MKKIRSFFNRLFWPVYTARNIAIVFGFGFFLILGGMLVDWMFTGSVRPSFKDGTPGQWFTGIGAGAWILTFFVWTIRGFFGAPRIYEIDDSDMRTRSVNLRVELPENTYLQSLKVRVMDFLDVVSFDKSLVRAFILATLALLLGVLFPGSFLDFTNVGVVLLVWSSGLWIYREFFAEMYV